MARLTMEPVLHPALLGRPNTVARPLLCDPRSRWYRSGRHALQAALLAGGVGHGDRVLVPAYHCESMLDPVRWCGALPVPYDLDAELAPDLAALEQLAAMPFKALLAAHFFGYARDFGPLRLLCDRHNAVLIEDCAHTVFGHHVGRYGDYAITSARKLLPQYDGGSVVRLRPGDEPARSGRSARYELKCLYNTFALARTGRRANSAGRPAAPSPDPVATVSYADPRFDQVTSGAPMSVFSGLLRRLTNWQKLCVRRRRNYSRLATALHDDARYTLLHPLMPEDCVPYALPVILDDAERHAALRSAGVPMYRWESLQASSCTVSEGYRLKLVQIPCHQGLGDREIDILAAKLLNTGGRA